MPAPCYIQYQLDPKREDSVFGMGFFSRATVENMLFQTASPFYHCSVILEGKGVVIDDELHAYPVTTGCVFQRFPDHSYTLHVDTAVPFTEFQLTSNRATMEALRSFSSFHDGIPVFSIQLYPHLRQWMQELAQSALNAPPSMRLELYFSLQRLLAAIHLEAEDSDYSQAFSLINFASQRMLTNLQHPPSIRELAEACQMSYARLSQIFKAYTRSTPLEYLQHVKFCAAAKELHCGKSIREVAAMMGYSDQFSFSKQFKRSMGISPSECLRQISSPLWGLSDT